MIQDAWQLEIKYIFEAYVFPSLFDKYMIKISIVGDKIVPDAVTIIFGADKMADIISALRLPPDSISSLVGTLICLGMTVFNSMYFVDASRVVRIIYPVDHSGCRCLYF